MQEEPTPWRKQRDTEGGDESPRKERAGQRPRKPIDNSEERRPWQNREQGGGEERRPWQNREQGGGERRPWENREQGGGERRPWQNREQGGGERRPWENREQGGGERRPWENREQGGGERRPWQNREQGGGERRPWQNREQGGGERRPWENREQGGGERRPWQNREQGGGERRPWENREQGAGERRPWENREQGGGERRPWENREQGGGERRPWENREQGGGERRPWQNREQGGGERRPWQNREQGGGERRPWQNREQGGGERRPWQNREQGGGERRPWENREQGGGERRPWQNRDERKQFYRQDTPPRAPRYPSEPGETLLENLDSVRINRYIASTGFCSRRKADDYIKEGLVTLNGKLVDAPGEQVRPGVDQVHVAGQLMQEEKPVYILLNKPKNTITTANDPEGRQTVMDLVKGVKERVFPVGRLDRNTTGILLLTNDGALGKRMTHPSHMVRKIYHVELYDTPRQEDLQRLAEGIELEDGPIKADRIDYVDDVVGPKVGIEVHSGRNRIVRRMFEHLGFEIKSLDRVAFGPLDTKSVPRGEWRYLSAAEIKQLRAQK